MHDPGHVLHTARLTLRPPRRTDAGAIARALGDWQVTRWLTRAPYPYGERDALDFIADNARNLGKVWMIEDRSGLVGCVGRKGEFGYWLARRAWGRGYATEAGRAVLDFHFRDPAARPILSGHLPGNLRSRRVLEKLGFAPSPNRSTRSTQSGRVIPVVGLRLTRDGYRAAIAP